MGSIEADCLSEARNDQTPSLRLTLPLILAAVLGGSALSAVAAESSTISAQPGVYRMKLGAYTVIALSDGEFALPTDQLLIENAPGHQPIVRARKSLDY